MNSDDIDIGAAVRELWNARWAVLAIGSACTAIALLVALLWEPVYRATAIVAEMPDPAGISSTGALHGQLAGLAALAGANLSGKSGRSAPPRAVLQSWQVMEQFIQQEHLLPLLFDERWAAESESWAVESEKIPTLWAGAHRLRERVLDIREDRRTGLIFVHVTWRDPVTAAHWANEITRVADQIIRKKDTENAQRSLAYLNEEVSKTSTVELQRVLYGLIESEMKTLLFANARDEYALTIIDPAVPPERRLHPRRTLIVLAGIFLGGVLGLLYAIFIATYRKELSRSA